MDDVPLAQLTSHPLSHLAADVGQVVVGQPAVEHAGWIEHLAMTDQMNDGSAWRHLVKPQLRHWRRRAARRRSGSWHHLRAQRTKTKLRTRWAADRPRRPASSGRTRRSGMSTG